MKPPIFAGYASMEEMLFGNAIAAGFIPKYFRNSPLYRQPEVQQTPITVVIAPGPDRTASPPPLPVVEVDEEIRRQRERNMLGEKLRAAVAAEDFELAAKLRDELRQFESENNSEQSATEQSISEQNVKGEME
jgi:hypothetical protein